MNKATAVVVVAALLQLPETWARIGSAVHDFDELCPILCTREYIPVCDSNHTEHPNKCLFDVAVCKNPQLIEQPCATESESD